MQLSWEETKSSLRYATGAWLDSSALLRVSGCGREIFLKYSFCRSTNTGHIDVPTALPESEQLQASLLKVAIMAIDQIAYPQRKICIRQGADLLNRKALESLFEKNNSVWILKTEFDYCEDRQKIKTFLRDYIQLAPKIGRGYLADVSHFCQNSLLSLNSEYFEIAWGLTNWARHSEVASDELLAIDRWCGGRHGLEIGAGSGRVTRRLAEKYHQLTATDIVRNPTLTAGMSNLNHILDDITATALPEQAFDQVTFWENGLGGILSQKLRLQAIANMAKLLKPGGQLILGVRNLLPVSIDHVMPAAQCPNVLGIFHTFAEDEWKSWEGPQLSLAETIEGDCRPAGGRQVFLRYEKSR